MGPLLPGSGATALSPLGSLREVHAHLAEFNTAPDGAPSRSAATQFLYGPGYSVEIATTEPVMQGIITVTDDDIAMPVLFRLVRVLKWRMMDMESGRIFGE
jgi:hypothetical protein